MADGVPLRSEVSEVVRVAAIVLTAITGFSGLVYEVAWQKYL